MGDAGRPLSHEEMLIMQQHPRIGAEIADAANFDPLVHEAVHGHHERLDGSGYPRQLRGAQIPLSARIIAVCEVWDSMTNRAYHSQSSGTISATVELRTNAGILYDARVVDALLGLVEETADEDMHLVELDSLESLAQTA
jgi:HD-GYP domain-containing protein (c-di-GMP phosphodiesterase class II)